MFCNLLPPALKKKSSENSIKRLSALFMAESVFLSVNSEYGWLWFQCQVVCYTAFVICFQAAWAQRPWKILWNIKKTRQERQKEEGGTDPSCQASPVHLGFLVASSIWVLFRSIVSSFLHEWAPFITMHQVVSVSCILPVPGLSRCGSECLPAQPSISFCDFRLSLLYLAS